MRVAVINQPALFPWAGEWSKLSGASVSICLDSVKYQKAGFLARARISDGSASRWLTVPTDSASRRREIAGVRPLPVSQWLTGCVDKLADAYRGAPFRDDAIELFESVSSRAQPTAVDLAEDALVECARYLDFPMPERVRASTIDTSSNSSELLVEILKDVGADAYIFGPGNGRRPQYLDEDLLRSAGVVPMKMEYSDAAVKDGPAPTRFSILHDIAHRGPAARDLIGVLCA